MKENSIGEDIKIIEDFILKTDVDYSEYNEQIVGDISYQAIQHLLSAYQEVLKENEELKQDRNNNYQMIALAQNEALGYMQGYEDGKANRGSAVQIIIDNQQYHIFRNQIEKYKEHIEKLQKENEELKEERQIVGIPVKNKRDGRIGIVLHQWESGSVAVLESINPRVINTHDSWNTLEIVTDEVKQTQTKCETIPVQKVKDKIEEILNNGEYTIIFEGDAEFPDEATRIDAQKYIKLEKLQELLEGRK